MDTTLNEPPDPNDHELPTNTRDEDIERLIWLEGLEAAAAEKGVASGTLVVLGRGNSTKILVGKGASTKVNVNLGTSTAKASLEDELEKTRVAMELGAHTISDCSVGGDLDSIRRALLRESKLPVTTIPVYQATVVSGRFEEVTDRAILQTVERHVSDGASSIVIHAGFSREDLEILRHHGRLMGVVSKGGSMTAAIALTQTRENPFITLFDDIVEILAGTGVVLNLGNAMRSGCIHDLQDEPQLRETRRNAELASRASKEGVPVIIEGLGGHVSAYHLEEWVREHKRLTDGRPLFVAGPLPTDIGVGHDHVSAAIGGAIAAGHGADYLCAITPAEHLALPTVEHVRAGIVASLIAAHVADSLKYGLDRTFDRDANLARCRASNSFDGQLGHAIDQSTAKSIKGTKGGECTMCGKYCALKIMKDYLGLSGLDSEFTTGAPEKEK